MVWQTIGEKLIAISLSPHPGEIFPIHITNICLVYSCLVHRIYKKKLLQIHNKIQHNRKIPKTWQVISQERKSDWQL